MTMELYGNECRAEGRAEGRADTLYELVQEGILSLLQGAAKAGVSEELFLSGMKAAGYKLP